MFARLFPFFMWSLPLSFFGFQFILRLFPGLVMNEFLALFQISATDFGIFASLYYLGYAGMQIPVALLLDKFGPRKVLSASAVLCGLAVWMLVFIQDWKVALLSRFLVGVGSVAGFLGTSKVISVWFKKEKYSTMVGLTFSFGLIGAIYGGRPISLLIISAGWSQVLMVLGGISLLIGLMLLLFLRDKSPTEPTNVNVLQSLKELLRNKNLLVLAVANLLMVGALEGFADVWGVPFLMTAKGFSKMEAAGITSFVFVGMLFGGPILAYFAEKFKADHLVTATCGVLMALLLSTVILMNGQMTSSLLMMVMFAIGVLCCYQVIVFTIGAKEVPAHLMSITIAFLNCINMLGGSFFHTTIGRLMDYFEQGTLIDGIKHYSLDTFTTALMMIPIASLVGAALVWVSKRKISASVEVVAPSS